MGVETLTIDTGKERTLYFHLIARAERRTNYMWSIVLYLKQRTSALLN